MEKDIFDVLKFSDNVIIWKKSEKDLILFTEAEWNWFVFQMKDKGGFSDKDLNYTAEGRQFMRGLYARVQPLLLKKNNIISFVRGCSVRTSLEGKNFFVSFCI